MPQPFLLLNECNQCYFKKQAIFLKKTKNKYKRVAFKIINNYVSIMIKSKYITIEETAKILKVTKPTVYNYIKEGLLTKYRIKKKPVFSMEEVKSLLEPHLVP